MLTPIPRTSDWLADLQPEEMKRLVEALYRVHGLVSAINDHEALLFKIMEESQDVAKAEACSLLLYDKNTDELFFHVALGEDGDQAALKDDVRLKLDEGIAGACARERRTINILDAEHDPRFFSEADEVTRFKTHSILAIPLLDKGELVGVLELLNKVGADSFSDVDQRVMEVFSSLVATLIANARLIEDNLHSERLAAIGEAVAGLSHYTKNIITSMEGSVELIDESLAKDELGTLKTGWGILRRSVGRIGNVVQDMLAYSKPRTPLRESCDLKELIEETLQPICEAHRAKGLLIEKDISGIVEPVYADSRGLHRCLLNLIGNAADAVPQTGGAIWVRAFSNEHECVIEVADNGPGIPDLLLEEVFEPFFSTKGSRGTGLGLAVTRKIVEEHNGTIAVRSRTPNGAHFRLTLPQERPA